MATGISNAQFAPINGENLKLTISPVLAEIKTFINDLVADGVMTGDKGAEAIATIMSAGIQSATQAYLAKEKANAEVSAINQKRQTEFYQTGLTPDATGEPSVIPDATTDSSHSVTTINSNNQSVLKQSVLTQRAQVDSWVNDAKNNYLKAIGNLYVAKEERSDVNNPTSTQFPEMDARTDSGIFRDIVRDASPSINNSTNITGDGAGSELGKGLFDFAKANALTNPPIANQNILKAPTRLTAISVNNTHINVSWDIVKIKDYIITYEIWRSEQNDSNTAIKTINVPVNIISIINDGLTSNTKYFYWVKSCTGTGASAVCSDFSNIASATTNNILSQ